MSHILRNLDKKIHEDRYNTKDLSLTEKTNVYEKKISDLKIIKTNHKNSITELKSLKSSSENVLKFKLDEMTKKMKNEIYRLSEEARRHDESQKNENTKIQTQINYIRDHCEGFGKALQELLERVENLEQTLGPKTD